MEVKYTLEAKEDLLYWKKTNSETILKKIRKLIEAIIENPFEGLGKPEPLKHSLSGCWSRRINKKHRLVYEVYENIILIHSMKDHY
jgi:toxin YoeB